MNEGQVGGSVGEGQGAVEDPGAGQGRPPVLRRVHTALHRNRVTGLVTKVVVTVVGAVVIATGIFLSGPGIPGPGFLVILGGLAILATEYEWARRALEWARERYENAKQKVADMDPKVRRRRTLLTVGVAALALGAAAAYLAVYDWPGFAIDGWDRLQGISGAVPDLPGM